MGKGSCGVMAWPNGGWHYAADMSVKGEALILNYSKLMCYVKAWESNLIMLAMVKYLVEKHACDPSGEM